MEKGFLSLPSHVLFGPPDPFRKHDFAARPKKKWHFCRFPILEVLMEKLKGFF